MSKHKPRLDIYPFSDLGRREHQEDYFYTDPPMREGRPWLGTVCDGMGGHAHGDIASQAGVHAIKLAFDAAVTSGKSTDRALTDATYKGHEAVLRAAEEAGSLGDMGSTVVAFAVDGPTLHWCCAGDSRLYLCRADKLLQLSRDFTVGEDMRQGLSGGGWTQEDIENSPQRNALTSFMGTDDWRSDAGSKALQHGDIVVACSDGVYGTIDSEGIVAACRSGAGMASAQQIAENMQKRVLDVGKSNQDNSTAIVVRFLQDGKGESRSPWASPGAWAMGGGSVFALAAVIAVAAHYLPSGPNGTVVAKADTKTSAPPPPASTPPPAPPPPPPAPPSTPSQTPIDEKGMNAQLEKVIALLKKNRAQETMDQVDLLLAGVSEPTGAVAVFQKRLHDLRDQAWIKRLQGEINAVTTSPLLGRGTRLDELIQRRSKELAEVRGAPAHTQAATLLTNTAAQAKTLMQAESKKNEEARRLEAARKAEELRRAGDRPAPPAATEPSSTRDAEKILNGGSIPAPATASASASGTGSSGAPKPREPSANAETPSPSASGPNR